MGNQRLILEILLHDTRHGELKWHCGAHSDIWSGEHKDYTIDVSDGFLWWGPRLTIKHHKFGQFTFLSLTRKEWALIMDAKTNQHLITEAEMATLLTKD